MSGDQRIKLLVVEDQEISRYGLKLTLGNCDRFEVIADVGDGHSAIEAAKNLKPDVVLMDIGLPDIDGIEAGKEIRTNLPNTRLIMFTSHESQVQVFAALSAGADGYCLKNISFASLFQAIMSVHENPGIVWLDPGVAQYVLRTLTATDAAHRGRPADEHKSDLTAREIDVLKLLVEGLSNAKIADKLVVSPETVKTHVRHIMEKLSVADRTQAAVKALRQGLFS